MTLARHSSPGIVSLWLHFLRSKVLAKSTVGCCDFPWRYNSCIQHCVITNERLCSQGCSVVIKYQFWKNSLGFTVPCSTDPSCLISSNLWSVAVLHISESTGIMCAFRKYAIDVQVSGTHRALGMAVWTRMTWSTASSACDRLWCAFAASFDLFARTSM
jgi:hypothetical protein